MSNGAMFVLFPFFKGNSIESEFGFVNYYHFHPMNRLLHTLAVPLLIFGIFTTTYSIDYRLSLLFYIGYCTIVLLFDYKVAKAYFILFGLLFILAIIFSSSRRLPILYGIVIFFIGLIIQGIGHFIFEKSTPAFRIFEAIFTTPVFLMMYLITDHNKPFWHNVEKETNKWKEILNK
jgi:uncharacterized membrane protein YGL010W